VINVARLFLLASALSLFACAGQQTSPERHATHAAHQLAQVQFDPGFHMLIADSIRIMKPGFEQFYQDRAAGMTPAGAEKRIAGFSDPEFLPASRMINTFVGKTYSADQPQKERKILIESLTATYRDGYEGRS